MERSYADEVEYCLENLAEMLFQVHMTFYMNGALMPRQLVMENATFSELQGFVDLVTINDWNDALTLDLAEEGICFAIDDYSKEVCVYGIEPMEGQ